MKCSPHIEKYSRSIRTVEDVLAERERCPTCDGFGWYIGVGHKTATGQRSRDKFNCPDCNGGGKRKDADI